MSRLALIIPAHNAEPVLGRLLDSAHAQTVPFDEVLVYDDASSDRTSELARARGATVLRSIRNTGPSYGKNALARSTRCEWVHFHDADETLSPDFVKLAHDWMRKPGHEVVVFATEDRDDETGKFLQRHVWDDEALRADAVRYSILDNLTNCGIYRRDKFLAAGGFDLDEATKYNEDRAMHLQLALAGLRFRADPYVGVIVYRRRHSMSADHPVECARAQYEVTRKVADATGLKYAAAIGERMWRLAGVCASYSDWAYVRKCLALARRVGYRDPEQEHWGIRLMARVSALGAVAVREQIVRSLKPFLRLGLPSAASIPAPPLRSTNSRP